MRGKYSVSDAEWEVLKMIWKCGKGIRQPELLELCGQEGKEWKRQTLNTFLARLEEKGLIRREKGIVSAIYTEEEYNAMQMREAIDTLYDGKLSNFLAAFVKRNTVGEDEIAKLQHILEQKI